MCLKNPRRVDEQTINSTLPRRSLRLQNSQPSVTTPDSVRLTTSKRPRKDELTSSYSKPGPAQKRLRLTATSVTKPIEFKTTREARIAYWREYFNWPNKEQEMDRFRDLVQQSLARKRSTASLRRKRSDASTQGDAAQSRTSSDQQPRDQKSAPYKHPRYEGHLQERGSFMDDYEEGITTESEQLCKKLLKARFDPPEQTLFSDDNLFKRTFKRIRGENETKVIRDIAPLIVPSAEILADRGEKHLEICRETTNAGWINAIPFYGSRPQPDFSLGFKREAFSREQLRKLEPFIGNELEDCSYIAATYNMYFPFLTSEVKCGASALDIADRQNAHSQTVALRNLFQLFRLVGREHELNRALKGFSISHSDVDVRIFGHYIVIDEGDATYYRHPITKFDISPTEEGDHRWKAHDFVRKIYDSWVPEHFKLICSIIDKIPPDVNFEVSEIQSRTQSQDHELASSRSGLSQQFEEYRLIDNRVIPDSQSSALITPEPTTQTESGIPKRRRKQNLDDK